MDPTIDLDEVLERMIDEELEDNTDEEIIRLILKIQQQLHGNTTGCSQRRIVVHHNHEEVECLKRFISSIYTIFGNEYLRRPNNEDNERLLQMGATRGFPGMLGFIDCMHWKWKNCPDAWKGQFCRGDHRNPTIILEAVTSQDLWIWHGFFGTAGSNNDITVLNGSNVFDEVLSGRAPTVQFTVNRT
ncbi:hypothetical protein HKD37_07G018195 [Glycine soja]